MSAINALGEVSRALLLVRWSGRGLANFEDLDVAAVPGNVVGRLLMTTAQGVKIQN